jgi:hypothetical protein
VQCAVVNLCTLKSHARGGIPAVCSLPPAWCAAGVAVHAHHLVHALHRLLRAGFPSKCTVSIILYVKFKPARMTAASTGHANTLTSSLSLPPLCSPHTPHLHIPRPGTLHQDMAVPVKLQACFSSAFFCTQLACHLLDRRLPLSRAQRIELRHLAVSCIMAFIIIVSNSRSRTKRAAATVLPHV